MPLKNNYYQQIVPELQKSLSYKNRLAVPRLQKIVVNVGIGRALKEKQFAETVTSNLTQITGQKPVPTKAKHSIAGFGIREGLIIGSKVTLRGNRMYDLVEKIIHVVLPRVRDFQGLPYKLVDQNGNLTIGFKDITVFPEINPENVSNSHGLEVTIVSNAQTREASLGLLTALGFPFKKK